MSFRDVQNHMSYVLTTLRTLTKFLENKSSTVSFNIGSKPLWWTATPVMLYNIMLCYVMLCYDMLCYVMLCYVMLCYVML